MSHNDASNGGLGGAQRRKGRPAHEVRDVDWPGYAFAITFLVNSSHESASFFAESELMPTNGNR